VKTTHAKIWSFLFLALAAILMLDTSIFYSDITLPGGGFKTGADCGTGLYLLLGFPEVTDRLPYDEAPAVFRLLCVVIVLVLLTALCFFGYSRYSKRKKANV
jgi:hypothetical protein